LKIPLGQFEVTSIDASISSYELQNSLVQMTSICIMAKLIPTNKIIELKRLGLSSREIAQQLSEELGVSVSHTTICNKLRKADIQPETLLIPRPQESNNVPDAFEFNIVAEFKKLREHATELYQKEKERLEQAKRTGNSKLQIKVLNNLQKIAKLQKKFSRRSFR